MLLIHCQSASNTQTGFNTATTNVGTMADTEINAINTELSAFTTCIQNVQDSYTNTMIF